MDILQDARELSKKSFFMLVFSSTDEGKAEIINIVQYAIMGIIPMVLLNKIIHYFIPESDLDKSTLELLVEIFLHSTVLFCGILTIHRITLSRSRICPGHSMHIYSLGRIVSYI